MYVSKVNGESGGYASPPSKGMLEMQAEYPALYEYMTLRQYPDGSSREVSTLLMLVEAGRLKLCLSDRDQGRSLWVTVETILDGLAALEGELTSPSPDWRKSGGGSRRGGK